MDYENKRVGLNNVWKNEKLNNHWVISSYELYDTEKQALRSTPQAITKEKAFNSLNSVKPNPTTSVLKTQEAKILSPLEQAQAEKLLKLESERLASEEDFLRYKQESKKLNLIFELIYKDYSVEQRDRIV